VRKVHETVGPYAEAEAEKVAAAMPVLARLLEGKPLDERRYWSNQRRAEQQWDWAPALPRTIGPGSVVRVKPDAYADNRRGHNGKVGTVVAIRRDVIVDYSGGGIGMGYHHEMSKLERRVPLQAE
jgi:hypothetical protein